MPVRSPAGLADLKERHGRIHVMGSLGLLQSLLALGLVDCLDLWVYPLVLGSGKRVFEGGSAPSSLRLTESRTFQSGAVHLEYEWTGEPIAT